MITVTLGCENGHNQIFTLPEPYGEQSAEQFARLLVESSAGCGICLAAGISGVDVTATVSGRGDTTTVSKPPRLEKGEDGAEAATPATGEPPDVPDES
jgi:hypothetical protein